MRLSKRQRQALASKRDRRAERDSSPVYRTASTSYRSLPGLKLLVLGGALAHPYPVGLARLVGRNGVHISEMATSGAGWASRGGAMASVWRCAAASFAAALGVPAVGYCRGAAGLAAAACGHRRSAHRGVPRWDACEPVRPAPARLVHGATAHRLVLTGGGLWRAGSLAPGVAVASAPSAARHVHLYPKRSWKRKPGIGVSGGQKLKSHSGANKRFKVSANKKVRVMPAGKQHLNYGTRGQKRQKLRKWRNLHETQAKTIRMLMLKHGRVLHPYYKPKTKLELRAKPLTDSELQAALG